MGEINTVLVTGITGMVGSHLAEFIVREHPGVRIIGLTRWRSPKEHISHLIKAGTVELAYGDLTDYASLYRIINDHRPDVIFHLAAQSYVDFSFVAPAQTLDTNVTGTCNLLEVIKTLKQQTSNAYDPVVHTCSSSEVYGQVKNDEVPITENNRFRPASPYAVSKVGEDMLAMQYWMSWGVKTIRTRMFTHTGPRRGEVFVESNFARQVAMIEKGLQSPVIKVGNLHSVRTFADVRDTVRAYWELVTKCTPGEVYNIGGVETMTIGEMLDHLIDISDLNRSDVKIEIDPARLRPSDVTLQIPDTSKFVNQTGWSPQITVKQTLSDLLSYWRENI